VGNYQFGARGLIRQGRAALRVVGVTYRVTEHNFTLNSITLLFSSSPSSGYSMFNGAR
jgi:hypothetical protein